MREPSFNGALDAAQAGHGPHAAPVRPAAATPMPRSVRALLWAALLLVMLGALSLIFLRGDALLIDLAKLGSAFCF